MVSSSTFRSSRARAALAALTICSLCAIALVVGCEPAIEQSFGNRTAAADYVVADAGSGIKYATVAPADAGAFTGAPRIDLYDASLNKGWKFFLDVNATGVDASTAAFDDAQWSAVDVPHTWNALDGENGPTTTPGYFRGVGWYRKHFMVPAGMAGKQIYLQFDAAAYITNLWVNGQQIGEHRGGYAAFRFDVTAAVTPGADNVFAVKVDNSEGVNGNNQMVPGPMGDVSPLSGDFTFFGGIYRLVHLVATDKLAISPMDFGSSGVYMTAFDVTAAGANFEAKVMLANANADAKTPSVEVQILDKDAQQVLWVLTAAATAPPYRPTDGTDLTTLGLNPPVPVDAGADGDAGAAGQTEPPSVTLKGYIEHPHLWNGLADPYVYQVKVILRDGDTVVDSVQQPFGFRAMQFDINGSTSVNAQPYFGFLLNGQPYPLRGVCMHQDHRDRGGRFDMSDTTTDPATGVGKPTIDHDFEMLKEVGTNFVRFAHYQHSDYTYQKADQAGIVAWAENAFVNRIPLPATKAFQLNANKQYAELIKQNFNHPSIVMWSMSNEILMKPGPSPTGVEASLNPIQKKLDPHRVSCSAANGGQEDNDADWQGDVAAFNEYQGWYERTTAAFATWADASRAYQLSTRPRQHIGLSEYGAGANPDPAYTHELPIVERPGDRTGGWQTEEYQTYYHEVYYKKIAASSWLVISSVWNMFDFASDYRNEGNLPGENTKGLVTYDRSVKKDAFYMYKAQWNKSDPFVYINSRRYAGLARVVNEVKVYSNQSPVTLTINGTAVGTISDADNDKAHTLQHVFLFKGIQWVAGDNVVVATAGNVSDTVTWAR